MLLYYREKEEANLHQQLSQTAVGLAVQGRWEEAEAANRDIIERFATDVEAYNRLGRASIELGDFVKAKEAYAKALELAPNNAIAKKNLERLSSLPQATAPVGSGESSSERKPSAKTKKIVPDMFVVEMGKAGAVRFHNTDSSNGLTKLVVGDRVRLKVEGQHLILENEQGEYVGEVETRHARRIIKLISGGNRYDAAILNVGETGGRVIIKEVYQHPSQAGRLSFPIKSTAGLRSYAREGLIRHNIKALESEVEETDEIDEIEHPGDREEPELEGFAVLEESTESSDEEEIG